MTELVTGFLVIRLAVFSAKTLKLHVTKRVPQQRSLSKLTSASHPDNTNILLLSRLIATHLRDIVW